VALPGREASPSPAAEGAAARPGRGRVVLPWLLGAALLACAIGWALERRQSASLEAELGQTRVELEEARSLLEARQRHLEAVRAGVASLAAGLGELESLVSADPEAPAPEPGPARP
jgi:uncharacterized protein HemX